MMPIPVPIYYGGSAECPMWYAIVMLVTYICMIWILIEGFLVSSGKGEKYWFWCRLVDWISDKWEKVRR